MLNRCNLMGVSCPALERNVQYAMNARHKVLLGLIHHEDYQRTQSQRNQARPIVGALQEVGFLVLEAEEFHQVLIDSDALARFRIRALVLRRLWAQEMHHLREIRRRRGLSLKIPVRKRRKVLHRAFSIVKRRDSLVHAFRRLEIEAALSLKHCRIWSRVLDSDASGAVVLEDDFYLRDESSPRHLASLVRMHFQDFDLIDLAGGLSRGSLGLPDDPSGDLNIPFMVANTTCGYFISKTACQVLVDMVARNTELLYLAPDFLITELNVNGFEGSSLLPWALPLVHGSREGTVESSIPY